VFFRAKNGAKSASFRARNPRLSRAFFVAFCRRFSGAFLRAKHARNAHRNASKNARFWAFETRNPVRKTVSKWALERAFSASFLTPESAPKCAFPGTILGAFSTLKTRLFARRKRTVSGPEMCVETHAF